MELDRLSLWGWQESLLREVGGEGHVSFGRIRTDTCTHVCLEPIFCGLLFVLEFTCSKEMFTGLYIHCRIYVVFHLRTAVAKVTTRLLLHSQSWVVIPPNLYERAKTEGSEGSCWLTHASNSVMNSLMASNYLVYTL